jgi:hypothetical protein
MVSHIRCLFLPALLAIAFHIGFGQIIDDDPAVTGIKKVVVDAQRKVKPMKGHEASQCFTDDDKIKFDQNGDAKRIAAGAASSPEFEAGIKALRKRGKDYQLKVLDVLRSLRDKTYAEAQRFGPDVQTEAGAQAQSEIASEIVEIMRNRLPCCNKH